MRFQSWVPSGLCVCENHHGKPDLAGSYAGELSCAAGARFSGTRHSDACLEITAAKPGVARLSEEDGGRRNAIPDCATTAAGGGVGATGATVRSAHARHAPAGQRFPEPAERATASGTVVRQHPDRRYPGYRSAQWRNLERVDGTRSEERRVGKEGR